MTVNQLASYGQRVQIHALTEQHPPCTDISIAFSSTTSNTYRIDFTIRVANGVPMFRATRTVC